MAAPTASWAQDASSRSDFLSETEFEFEADLDGLLAFDEAHTPRSGPYADLSLRAHSETLTDRGWRYGVQTRLRVTTADGRRGLSGPDRDGPVVGGLPVAGLLSGVSADPQLDAADPRLFVEQAQLYLQTRWLRTQMGPGETAARQEASTGLHVFRLARAQGGAIDPSGLNIADTMLSLADGAAGVSVQTRRLLGLRASVSYAPQADPCAQHCHPSGPDVLRADLSSVWSLAASFDRRIPSSGVRWSASLGYETAQADQDPRLVFDDPWLVRADLSRQAGDVTLSLFGLSGSDGFQGAGYDSLGLNLAYEASDWLYGAEFGYGRSELVRTETVSALAGVSRLVGQRGVLGVGVMAVRENRPGADRNSLQLLIETGLRF